MKKLLSIPSLLALALATTMFTANAEVRVGTVDMNKIFSNYYKTKDAEARINDARTAAKKELDDRMDTWKKNLEAINKLNDEINKPELSKESKEEKSKLRDEKIAETKNLEREIKEFQSSREKQLQEQAVRMRNGIVEEITKLVMEKVKSGQYTLIFDKSGSSLNGVPIVLFSQESDDFSDDIIKELNKNKPKDTPAPSSKSDEKKADEKKAK